jgi:SAM-dependent methyltransferase
MSFAVPADAYDRFMGRYSVQLSPQLADFAGVAAGQRVIDVGCGPGALTADLVTRVSAPNVTAIDPSPSFVDAARARHPGVDVRQGSAESLPFADSTFDASLAQLVVHFMADPVAGVSDMARVTRDGGTVAACVWDHGGGRGPLSLFWNAVAELDPDAENESFLTGSRDGELVALFQGARLHDVEQTVMSAPVEHADFEAFWEPFTHGVGPAGTYLSRLDPDRLAKLRAACKALIPGEPFTIDAQAWAARGRR